MKHYYDVFFPQGTRQKNFRNGVLTSTSYCNTVSFNSKEQAYNFMIENNGAYFEKIQIGRRQGKFGRWCNQYTPNPKYNHLATMNEIWDAVIAENLPEVILPDNNWQE